VAGTQAQRLSDEPWGGARSGASNTPGTQDVHAELAAYAKSLVRAMVTDSPSAAKRQARSRAAELELVPWDDLGDLDSLPTRVAFLNQLHKEVSTAAKGAGTGLGGAWERPAPLPRSPLRCMLAESYN
jgi:hypothetical protein